MAQRLDAKPTVSIQYIKQWTINKMQNIENNELLNILKEMSKQNGNENSKDYWTKLTKFFNDNICQVSSFIEMVSSNLSQPNNPNYGEMIDLYLQLIDLNLKMLNNNQIAYEQFVCNNKHLLFNSDIWRQIERKLNVEIPTFIDATRNGTSINYVGNLESIDLQTVIIVKKSLLHSAGYKPVQYLTMEYLNYNKKKTDNKDNLHWP